jgi:hypothetical protein
MELAARLLVGGQTQSEKTLLALEGERALSPKRAARALVYQLSAAKRCEVFHNNVRMPALSDGTNQSRRLVPP